MSAAVIVFLISQIADVLTTIHALNRGATEANPIVRFFMERMGKGWIVAKLAIAGGVAWWMVAEGQEWLLWPFSALFLAVAVNNLRVAR